MGKLAVEIIDQPLNASSLRCNLRFLDRRVSPNFRLITDCTVLDRCKGSQKEALYLLRLELLERKVEQLREENRRLHALVEVRPPWWVRLMRGGFQGFRCSFDRPL